MSLEQSRHTHRCPPARSGKMKKYEKGRDMDRKEGERRGIQGIRTVLMGLSKQILHVFSSSLSPARS
jgi:hypothetical protein